MSRPAPRTVHIAFTKWCDRPHWEYDALALGHDAHGAWFAVPTGTLITRPGARIVTRQDQVILAPYDAGFVATFYAHGPSDPEPPCAVYVDITTPPEVDGDAVRAIDLDLDVIRGLHGRTWVDDEDEFAAHRAAYGYPEEVVAAALADCAAVMAALEDGEAPFDGATAGDWLARSRR